MLAVIKAVSPSGGDDSDVIQAAIREVAERPVTQGVCGAVLLKPGTFKCSKPIVIAHEGVVLRGSGLGKSGTIIEMTGEPHSAIVIEGPDLSFPQQAANNSYSILDNYIPTGTSEISVQNSEGLTPGQEIHIRWSRTEDWIRFMGMDQLVRKRKGQPDIPQTWMKAGTEVTIHRTIRSIDGNRITLDIPFTDAIDRQLQTQPATIIKTPHLQRLAQCGVESLQIVSPPHRGTLTAGKNVSIVFRGHSEDCWVKDIVMRETLNNVQIGENCGSSQLRKRIRITNPPSKREQVIQPIFQSGDRRC